ncbi:hypothetical protein SAMN05216324_11493 [Chryseobacterium limigenitum]|uniref:Uncharacterized protein n=1 Tax=Chryseobacterium limigenitum TaxID=1612149 RepID=A0A1K2IUW6_9FLAO|nr:hypothetical protein SAMN05216324_11493 [Chryseobacterium limigenitum]
MKESVSKDVIAVKSPANDVNFPNIESILNYKICYIRFIKMIR